MDLEKELIDIINNFNMKKQVEIAILFGSQARGDCDKNSDVDLAFLFEKQFLKNKNALEFRSELISFFSSKIKKECDVILINQAPPLLKYQIVKYGKKIYKDINFDYNSFFSLTLKEYFDFKYYQDFHNKRLMKRIKEGGSAGG